jgi:agmatinase
VVVGIPWDATSSYMRGAAEGPDAIRRATSSLLYNHFTERGYDLTDHWKVCDHGNVRVKKQTGLHQALYSKATLHDHDKSPLLFLGGDHFVTYPAFKVASEIQRNRLSLLYFDAHPDLYMSYDNSPYSHATVVSRILEENGSSSGVVCYVGIRASTKEQNDRIRSLNLSQYTSHDVYTKGCDTVSSAIRDGLQGGPVYLSIDLDCLDPAYAPGVGNPQPGGLATRQLLEILHGIAGLDIVAADIVEYSPRCDSQSGTTAFTSAILIKEIMGIIGKHETKGD